ncbi:MAG: RraA family protein [Alphaproteobacteria bacterium]|nr:RraA family protein [Alphaproteobacteria bacterium]MDP6516562.1 RraA family protein [Alphaproteobacteria bacterium]
MTDEPLNESELAALRALDTPTVCNAIEVGAPERRGFGFTSRSLHCMRPELPPMVGYARTVMVRAFRPTATPAADQVARRFAYLEYVADGAGPTISVVQDLDDAQAGFGAFWGEVNSNMHWALGCIGTVTNGSIRDIDDLAEGFQGLAGALTPSHGHMHVVDFGTEVNVAGMVVGTGDLVHADRHGAVVIPHELARGIPAAADLVSRREAVILAAAKTPGATVETIKQAMAEAAAVTS